MRCKKCKTGRLVIYTEMIFTCRVPIGDEGEIEWLWARPTHEADDAQELNNATRELTCTNIECRAINDDTGYALEDDQLISIAGKKETHDPLV